MALSCTGSLLSMADTVLAVGMKIALEAPVSEALAAK